MRYQILLSLAVFVFFSKPKAQINTQPLKKVEPEFIGGKAKFGSFIMKNYSYPSQALKANVTGQIVVRFRVTQNGGVDSVQATKHYGFGTGEEIVRVIKLTSGQWKPGRIDGKRAAMFVTMPMYLEPD